MRRLGWKLLVPLMFGVGVVAWTVHFLFHPVFTLTSCLDIHHVETPNLITDAVANSLLRSVAGVGFAVLLFRAVSRRFSLLPYPPIVSAPASVLASLLVGVMASIPLEWLELRAVFPIHIGHGFPNDAAFTSLVSSVILGLFWYSAERETRQSSPIPSMREMLGEQVPWYTAKPDLLLGSVIRYCQMKTLTLSIQLRYILIYVLATMPFIMVFYIVSHGMVDVRRSLYLAMFGFGIGTAAAYALPVIAGRPLSRIRTATASTLVSLLPAMAILLTEAVAFWLVGMVTIEAAFFGSTRLFPERVPHAQ